jgi:hypothetical protein
VVGAARERGGALDEQPGLAQRVAPGAADPTLWFPFPLMPAGRTRG